MDILNRSGIFRNTNDFYLKETRNLAAPKLVKFAAKRAGKTILDIGCATGDYCLQLTQRGFKCVGVDSNLKYVEKAISKGVEAYIASAPLLNFRDKSFDTILLFEILEHAKNPEEILAEAKRIARKNILITVPNSTQLNQLSALGLTLEHVLDEDHVNFFTKQSLSELLKKHFTCYNVVEKEPIIIAPFWIRKLFRALSWFRIVRPVAYFRLYAEGIVKK